MTRKFSRQTELWELFSASYRLRKLRGRAGETARQYRIQLNHFRRYLQREAAVADLTDDTLAEFLDWLAVDGGGRAAPTVNKAYWCLVALWRHAHDLGIVRRRPTLEPIDEPDQIPIAWLLDELRSLLATCSVVPGKIAELPARLWWLGLHWVIWSTGERIGAALAVKLSDANLDRGEILVPAISRKGKRKPKLYKLLPQAVEILRQLLACAPDRELLFPFPHNPATLYNRYKRILRAAGLPTDRKCKFHRLRKSFASHLEAAGGNATEALDHDSRRTTKRSYLDPRICGGENPATRLPRIEPPEAA